MTTAVTAKPVYIDSFAGKFRRSMGVTTAVAQRELLRLRAQPSQLFSQALQLVFFLLVYAVGLGGMVSQPGTGISFAAFVFPGVIAIMAVTSGVSAGLTFAWDREFGFMREMMIAPAPRLALCAGKVLGVTAQAVTLGAVFLLTGPLFGVALSPASYFLSVLTIALVATTFCLVGLAAAVNFTKVETLQSTTQLLMYPMLFLSGSVFDPGHTNRWLNLGVHLNPMTYGVDLLRHTLLAGNFNAVAPVSVDLAVSFVVCALMTALIRMRIGR